VALSTLHHVLDLEWMKEAYRLTRKDGAPGVDGVTAAEYAQNLEANLSDLLERIMSGRYQAPPVRRAYIPKADGSRRPLGLPTFEDKVAQRAIVMVLELVYEQDFLSCSYGFRPGRSAHQALLDLRSGFMSQGLRWVIDLDIASVLVDTSSRSTPTRRASSISAATDQMARTTRKRMEPRSPFSASATYGESHERARTSCGK
jgi:retron-type reverse transcriptase